MLEAASNRNKRDLSSAFLTECEFLWPSGWIRVYVERFDQSKDSGIIMPQLVQGNPQKQRTGVLIAINIAELVFYVKGQKNLAKQSLRKV